MSEDESNADPPAAKQPAAKQIGAGDGDGGVSDEQRAGVWDPKFAMAALIVAVLALVLIAGMITITWCKVSKYPAAVRTAEQWVDGSFADRASFSLAMIGLGVGSVLLLAAALLAAIAVRSKLIALEELPKTEMNINVPEGAEVAGASTFAARLAEIVVPFVEAIAKARGTAVVALAGTAIVIVALVQAGSISDGPTQAPPAEGNQVSDQPSTSPSDAGGGDDAPAPTSGG